MSKASEYKRLNDKKWLQARYIDKGMSGTQIAKEIGCDPSSVHRAIRRLGIESRKRTSKYAKLNEGDWLRKMYIDNSLSTHEIAREIGGATPGVVHSALVARSIPLRTSEEGKALRFPNGRFGERAANWKGGRVMRAGYVLVYKPEHPSASSHGYVQEHRLVAEENLGRLLTRDEVVHHKNGNKSDNRWENLEVVSRGRHVSNHFEEGYQAGTLKEENAKLKLRIAELEAELAKYRV